MEDDFSGISVKLFHGVEGLLGVLAKVKILRCCFGHCFQSVVVTIFRQFSFLMKSRDSRAASFS